MTLRSAILALLLCAAHAQARTLYVSLTGSHDTNAPAFSTWATAATNIQAAIDAAVAGDKIILAHGTYVSTNTPAVGYLQTSGVTIQGMRGTLFDADKTIIDARGISGQKPIAVLNSTNAVVRGLTLTGGNGLNEFTIYGFGGGLYVAASPGSVVENCIVRGNAVSYNPGHTGSGIYLSSSAGSMVRGCVVVGNKGESNVGVMGGFVPTYSIQNSIIEANTGQQIYGRIAGISIGNSIHGNVGGTIADTGGNLTSATTNSVCRLLGIAPASEGVGTNLVWRGVSAYIPRLGSLARKNGAVYSGIATASDGAGGPALVTSRPFLGRDVSTNLNHGGAVGCVTSAADSPFAGERSAAFDGASGYLDMGNVYNIGTNDLTLECWFKLNSTASNSTFAGKSYYGSTSGRYVAYFNAPSTIHFFVQYGNTTKLVESIGWTPETGKWEHVAATWERDAGLTLYLNGASNAFTAAVNSDDLALSQPFLVGCYHTKILYLNGSLSDVRIWNVARTPEQIAENYTNRLTGTEEGLVGYWPLKDSLINKIDTGPFNLDNPIIHPSYHEAF